VNDDGGLACATAALSLGLVTSVPEVGHAQQRPLVKALDEATRKGRTVVDMKQDWKVVYPFQK
jgi:hypothetical protein